MTRVILGALYPGQPGWTRWNDAPGSVIDIDAARYVARRAEEAHLDFIFMPEGLRLLETAGLIDEDKLTGRADALTMLATLLGSTERIGLVATLNSTYSEPRDLLRELATIDLLSEGRAAWNLVTSNDAFTGENFRRGGYLAYDERYGRAAEYVALLRQATTSWQLDDIIADTATDRPLTESATARRHLDVRGAYICHAGTFPVPSVTGQPPVLFQAGDSPDGRDFAAQWADAVFSHHVSGPSAAEFYRDTKSRLAQFGRPESDLKILPALKVVVGATKAEAIERAHELISVQLSDEVIRRELSAVWGVDLSNLDPDGPLPPFDPDPGTGGKFYSEATTPQQTADRWRRISAEHGYRSARRLLAHVHGGSVLADTATGVAEEMIARVETHLVDGFILAPSELTTGLDEVYDLVIPELVDRGAFRTDYETTTLRGHFGLSSAREEALR
ncbi:NtaA/DmoA family FMN-dependent monooxygenase [Herbiconiux daphne]|uniref:NtaA/DmoA family FMN-dependent monooxygenase n=1 Tax=Herbiconiux daphne TaxID=2970914 RepID=A0ABT2H6T3_9MICO|nr:NtaA/DmoA family FMN-dependent monooxygenase [Herbiconiux daphne]MCS5735660.1 NtaA/DmoA family FMN-dependent monooxygenase [Herbiconiux daphne]